MPISKFKNTHIEQIALDVHAKNAGMNRTAYIKHCIKAQTHKARLDAESKREESDIEKMYQALSELNANLNKRLDTIENKKLQMLNDRLVMICIGLINIFPNKKNELTEIFRLIEKPPKK